jgi:hypothetical protein
MEENLFKEIDTVKTQNDVNTAGSGQSWVEGSLLKNVQDECFFKLYNNK